MKTNRWFRRVFNSMQNMEEIGGPDLEEYIQVMEAIKSDIEQRIENAKSQGPTLTEEMRDKIQNHLADSMLEANDSSCWKEIAHCGYDGLDNMSDQELLEQIEHLDEDLHAEAAAQLVIEEVLS